MNTRDPFRRAPPRELVWLPIAIALMGIGGCDKPEPDTVVRFWSFHHFLDGAAGEEPLGPDRVQVGGRVNETIDFGSLVLRPPGVRSSRAVGEVFSNEAGRSYWVSAQAPFAAGQPGAAIGSSSELTQFQSFRKTSANAELRVTVSQAFLEAIDGNPGFPTAQECRWHEPGASFDDCGRVMWSWASFHVEAFDFAQQRTLVRTGGSVELAGWRGFFDFDAHTEAGARQPFWNQASFTFDPDVERLEGGHAIVALAAPIPIDIPLADVRLDDVFVVGVRLEANTLNLRQRESYLSAFLRDPSAGNGLEWAYSGVEPVETPPTRPALPAPEAAPLCPGAPEPAAGLLAFESATFETPELPGDGTTVVVTRSGGSRGAVSALLTTSDGSAVDGSDYRSISVPVLFADGEEGRRAVQIPLVVDGDAEANETVVLTLSDPRGCAALGAQDHAILTILDDDRPLVAPDTFTIGGTVSGLLGTGLVLTEVITGFQVTPGNGPFVFGTRRPTGQDYEVRVSVQPTNPLQICAVANGTGTIGTSDVTDVAVTCSTPPPPGGLDDGFGTDGRVTEGVPGGAAAIALQPDGKILVVGGLTLARYDSDGTLDGTFGSGGKVTLVFNGGVLDEAFGVALQPDGRIVVVGTTRVGAQDDFGIVRHEASGAPDTGFGTGGLVTTDFAGRFDKAVAVAIQPDGKLVVAGLASLGVGVVDFAVARYDTSGAPDATFGSGGKVTTDIAGKTDLLAAMVLQPDGRIVVVGRVAPDGGADPDTGVVRYGSNGAPDESFGSHGIVRLPLSTAGWDEATGIVLQPDGKLLVSVENLVGSRFDFSVARLTVDGDLDLSFGTAGVASTDFAGDHDFVHGLALQSDGSIVLAGQSSNTTGPDFALARFTSTGVLDTGFGTGGKLTVDFFGSSDGATCVALQPDGRILVAGVARNGSSTGLGMVRVAP